jgi:rare lipoprotein A (peptidoglycan hydrolase)
MTILRRAALFLHPVVTLVFSAWLPSAGDVWGDANQHDVEAMTEKVEKRAKRTQKAEGKHNLVKDAVRTKTNAEGEKVVEQVGEASFYGKGFHRKKTANQETFNQYALTAAHPTLPLGSEAKVTNLETGESVTVRINDRGPYVKGRDIDLSKRAAEKIGIKKDGEAPVKIEAVVPGEGKKDGTP